MKNTYANLSQLIEDVVNRLTEEELKSFEFEADGRQIDIEERIRNWYEGFRFIENLRGGGKKMNEILYRYRKNKNNEKFIDNLSIFFAKDCGRRKTNFDFAMQDAPWWSKLIFEIFLYFADLLRRKKMKIFEWMGKKFKGLKNRE